MDSEEKFGRLRIETSTPVPGWVGPLPYLDYWSVTNRGLKLTDEQQRFYKFLKMSMEKGEKISTPMVNPYLQLFRDEILLLASKTKTRAQAVTYAKRLTDVFGYSDVAVMRMLSEESAKMAQRRLNRYLRNEPARWVPLNEEVDAGGHHLVRGGFYLGNHLLLSNFNPQNAEFDPDTTPIEGPVINLDLDEAEVDVDLMKGYSTFVEMPAGLQNKIIAYLEGEALEDPDVLRYYVAGIEHRLLADADIRDDERILLLRHLDMFKERFGLQTPNYRKLYDAITQLIDFTMARYFYQNPEIVFPDIKITDSPDIIQSHLQYSLKHSDIDNSDTAAVIAKAVEMLPLPDGLPDVYAVDFRKYLTQNINSQLHWNVYREGNIKYYPINYDRGYHPASATVTTLSSWPLALQGVNRDLVVKIAIQYVSLMRHFVTFLFARSVGQSILLQANALPTWLDRSKMPGVSEALMGISPAEGSSLRRVPLGEVLDTMGFFRYSPFDDEKMLMLNIKLGAYGLRIATLGQKNIKYDFSEVVSVYPADYGEMTKRGTLPISLVLVAWMLAADKTTDSDFALADNWLKEQSSDPDKAVPAMAVLRWLAGRKMVMTAKRKAKAATLGKYVKRRDELVKLLLALVSDPERATPKRMKRLEAIYQLIGLDPVNIHSDMHRMATVGIPRPSKPHAAKGANEIDKAKLKSITQSTVKAQEILSEVFVSDDGPEEAPKPATPDSENPTLEVLKLLVNKTQWSRDEFSRICADHGETVGSMLERLNDFSYESLDEAVAEDADDIIVIDPDVAHQLLLLNR